MLERIIFMENKEPLSDVDAFFNLVEPQKIVALIIGFVIMTLLVRVINRVASKIQDSYPSYRLLALQIATVLNFSIYILGTFGLIYTILRPPKELLIAVGGRAAVVIGFHL